MLCENKRFIILAGFLGEIVSIVEQMPLLLDKWFCFAIQMCSV